MNIKKLALIAATMIMVASAIAQGGQRGRGFGQNFNDPVGLLGREDVQKDLALTDDQKAKVVDLKEKADGKRTEAMQAVRDSAGEDRASMRKLMTEAMEKLATENWTAVNAVITPEQVKRLKEISIQMQGPQIVTSNKEVQKALGITDDQIAKFKDLTDRQQKAQMELFQKMQSGEVDRAQMPEIMAKNNKVMGDEINKVLTDAQKAKLTEMGGKHFERVDPPRPGGAL